MQTGSEPRAFSNFIGGKWVASQGGVLESRNPATGELVARAAMSTASDVGAAIDAARASFDSGVWSSKRPADRAKVIREASELIRARLDELALLLTLENGKPSPTPGASS